MAQQSLYKSYNLYYQKVNLLYQKPEIKASLEVVISVFAVTMLVFFAIRPTITNVFQLQKKIEDLQTVEKKADNKVTQLYAANKALKDFSTEINLFNLAVPEKISYWEIAKRVEIIAKNNNVKLDQLKMPGGQAAGDAVISIQNKDKLKSLLKFTKGTVTKIEVTVSISGEQNGLFGFIQDIENMDRVALISTATISKIPKTSSLNEAPLRSDMSIVFYVFNN